MRAARGAATVRAKNGALREELGAVIFELRRTKVFRGASRKNLLGSTV